jgi:transposase
MFDKVPQGLKSSAILMNARGVPQREIASILGISESTIKRAKARELKYGDIDAGYQQVGRKPLFGPSIREVLSSLCDCSLTFYRRS